MLDASVAFWALGGETRFASIGEELLAPPLMWSETASALRAATWRGQLREEDGRALLARLASAPVSRRAPARLLRTAWTIAEDLGWAKTYDAEYLALARLVGGRVVTLDARMHRGARRTGLVTALRTG
ncbi:MAG: type II toxin-antitoxin system VapC family toxin [Solirubrobacteraceae bacterium]